MRKEKIGVYPGTFDPVTLGHVDLIRRALHIFDRVIIAVAQSGSDKRPLFSVEERMKLLKESTSSLGPRVRVESFSGLVVRYAKAKKALAMIRGVRMISDFEYEFQMALTNRKLSEEIETIFLMPHEKYAYLSSRLIKEIAVLGGAVKDFVPPCVDRALRKRLADTI